MKAESNHCILLPEGWPCTLAECPPGYFAWEYIPQGLTEPHHYEIGFKSEYGHQGGGPNGSGPQPPRSEVFNQAGEYLTMGELSPVQPLKIIWEDVDL